MALLGKTDWYSAEKKIILTIALAILIASVSVFAILYLMMSHALQEDIRARARVVNAYAESHLNLEGFVHINTLKDMRRDTYQDMQSMLDNIRQIANVRYLYTAKFNDRGQPMYLVDGLPPNSSDFRSPGDLIEQDIVPMLNRCLSGELIESDGVLNTEWGAIFLTYQDAATAPVRLYYTGWSSSTGEADWGLRPLFAGDKTPPSMYNISYYKNPTVDADIMKALGTTDRAEKTKLYTEVQEEIWKDAPWAFLVTEKLLYATSKKLTGMYVMPDANYFFEEIDLQ